MLRIAKMIMDRAGNPQNKLPVMVFLGDSVTEGGFETVLDGTKNPKDLEDVYHNLLKKRIEERFPGIDLQVINAGVGGDTAPAGLARLDRDVLSHQPDFCVVCFGLNDAARGKVGLKPYAAALGEIFDRLSAAGIETVIMTPNMMATYRSPSLKTGPYYAYTKRVVSLQNGGGMDAYMETARKTAAAQGVPICDCYACWKELAANGMDVTANLANLINHPTREMHHLFARELYAMMFQE